MKIGELFTYYVDHIKNPRSIALTRIRILTQSD